jgi:hypothetical protein
LRGGLAVLGRLVVVRLGRTTFAVDQIGADAGLLSGDFPAGHFRSPLAASHETQTKFTEEAMARN